jgi:hypothetical protein
MGDFRPDFPSPIKEEFLTLKGKQSISDHHHHHQGTKRCLPAKYFSRTEKLNSL